MDVQMGYDQLRLTPGAWLDLLGGVWTETQHSASPASYGNVASKFGSRPDG